MDRLVTLRPQRQRIVVTMKHWISKAGLRMASIQRRWATSVSSWRDLLRSDHVGVYQPHRRVTRDRSLPREAITRLCGGLSLIVRHLTSSSSKLLSIIRRQEG